jgi:hypothetical protein
MVFSKVVEGIVVNVVNVEDLQWIIDNPERYGDSALYIETDPTDFTKVWGRVGYSYDATTGEFTDPNAQQAEEQTQQD